MKLDSMTDHAKTPRLPVADRQLIKPLIHHINDPLTTETDQVVMQGHVGVKPRYVMPDVDFIDQPGPPQDREGVIHGVARHHGMPSLDASIEIVGAASAA
jgi:hypothetical protein